MDNRKPNKTLTAGFTLAVADYNNDGDLDLAYDLVRGGVLDLDLRHSALQVRGLTGQPRRRVLQENGLQSFLLRV